MSQLRPSTDVRSLLSLGKSDGPSGAVRAKMWAGVSSSVGVAGSTLGAGSVGADGAAASGWAVSAKMLALGTLFGGPLTIGIALAVLRVGPAPATPSLLPHAAVATAAPMRTVSFDEERAPAREATQAPSAGVLRGAAATASPGVRVDDPAIVRLAPLATEPPLAVAETTAPEGIKPSTSVEPTGPSPIRAMRPLPIRDLLAREASLVAEGRSALQHGDAQRALAAIHAARALASHQLEPEELAVEIQSLRALGREREAVQTEVVLKVSYPESDLGR